MTLSADVTRHHTAWVHCSGCRPTAVRYAVDRDRLVCFGDELPDDATEGRDVFVNVHEIAGGPALEHLHGRVRVVEADDVDPNAVLELLDHVSLGRTADEVTAAIERHRRRRLVAFVFDGRSAA
jgi:hypothetical protein